MLNAYLQPVASRENLFGATVAYALAALTRYAGLVFIIAAGLSLLLLREGKIKSRLSDALLFGFGGSLPILIFLCRNWILAGNATNRPAPYWHPPELQAILDGAHVVLMWFLPDRVALQLNSYVSGAFLLLLFAALIYATFIKAEHRRDRILNGRGCC